jgi:hypothetical protein
MTAAAEAEVRVERSGVREAGVRFSLTSGVSKL